jgi:hypothetical protein
MLHPLPKNVYSLCLVSTLAITTHPPRCCEDRARLVADKLANGKEPKDASLREREAKSACNQEREAQSACKQEREAQSACTQEREAQSACK